MNDSNVFVGIDYHKRYSVISAVDGAGRRLLEARVNGNTPDGGRTTFKRLPGPAKVAVEACWNWGKLHDMLEELPEVEEIVLSPPLQGADHRRVADQDRQARRPETGGTVARELHQPRLRSPTAGAEEG
jgi:hypothetical protein